MAIEYQVDPDYAPMSLIPAYVINFQDLRPLEVDKEAKDEVSAHWW